ncbi:hypothetical protein KPH14_012949 [Odynerus spinipes]|uniref:Uncharacterized protein n=1 Tax=Odynerus spinipes TaxID=1348599 RepID=A0AAD9R8Y4_9HYME|nr:hypothetical protein KPH14_012949 [Odynerus spinipes]
MSNSSAADGSTSKGKIPLDMFKTDSPDAVGGIIGSSSMSTTFAFRLSDKCNASPYRKDNGKKKDVRAISTLYIGQEDKTNKNLVYLVDENLSVLEPNANNDFITDIKGTNKYIIDLIGFSGIVKAPVRITMFQNDPDQSTNPYQDIIYQTTLQSKSMYTDNVRDLHTI